MEYSIKSKAFSLLDAGKYNEAIVCLDDANIFDEQQIDWEVLKLYNNYLIACFHSQQIDKGVLAADKLQSIAYRNPHIYHNAACLYCKHGSLEKALGQIKLAKKYGGMELMSIIKDDTDLAPIASHPEFIQSLLSVQRKYDCEKLVIPFEGVDHFQFDELEKDEMVSMFFLFETAFVDARKKKVTSMIKAMASKGGWHNFLIENNKSIFGWRDGTLIGKDFITLHLKDVLQPKNIMKEVFGLMQSFEENLKESFFVKREMNKHGGFGTVNLSISESALPAAFATVKTEQAFWESSFNYSGHYPSPECKGYLKFYGHHDGSESAELRSLTYDPYFRISYGLVETTIIEDNEHSKSIYQFFQDELSRYFCNDIPIVLNELGDAKADRITAYGRIGYAFEISNDEILEVFYTRYVLRVREAELFKALKDTILHFGLSPIIHWYRGNELVFHIWENEI